MRKFLILFIAVISALGLINIMGDIFKYSLPEVTVAKAISQTSEKKIICSGKIKEKNTVELTVNFPVFYDEIRVKEGDRVKAGDILAKINKEETAEYLKKLDSKNLNDILSNFGFTQNVISIFNSENEMLSDYSEILNNIDGYCKDIIAPRDGTVVSSNIEGKTLMTSPSSIVISDRNEMTFESYINEEKIGEIAIGQKCIVNCKAVTDENFVGTVSYISPNSNGGKVKIQIDLKNTQNRLRYGYDAEGYIITKTYENAVTVPFEAIIKRGSKSYVCVSSNNRAYLKEIEVLTESLEGCAVRGINYGENVILNADSITDGQSIKVR